MKKIIGLIATPFQKWRTPITDGIIEFKLTYRPAIQMWFIDITFGTFILKGMRVCASLNLLHQYKKILPFGLFIHIADGVEPFLINDFSIGRVIIYILDSTEKDSIDTYYQNQKELISIGD
jgi:hypothetical protein